jgi:hypothetical protein
MERVNKVLGVLLLLTLAAPLALAQETWTPQVNVSPIRDFLVQVLKWTTYVAALFIITYVVLKVLYGRALASTGAPGVASRGYTEKWEGLASLVWFAVAYIALPFIIWIIAKVGALPPWVANEMANVIKEIWYWSPGG